jgi:hypothetical protein
MIVELKFPNSYQKHLKDDVDDIINEHTYDLNADTELGIKEYLERDYSDMFAQYGLPMTGTFYRKTVKLNDLMKTYQKYNPKFNIGIYSLLRRIINLENIDSTTGLRITYMSLEQVIMNTVVPTMP